MSIYPYYLIKKSQASQSQEREGGRVRGGERVKQGRGHPRKRGQPEQRLGPDTQCEVGGCKVGRCKQTGMASSHSERWGGGLGHAGSWKAWKGKLRSLALPSLGH